MIKSKISVLASLLLIGSTALYAGSVVGSPHDLSLITTAADNDAAAYDNGETCVYCHTPHAANIAFDGAPLWNKDDNTTKSYLMYGASGTVGATGLTIALTQVGGDVNLVSNSSLACLSCHDGISAVDSVVNAPGSGLSGVGGAGVTGTNDIVELLASTAVYGGNIGGDFGTSTGSTTVDLSNDHPISIIYDTTADGNGTASLKPTNTVLTGWSGATDIASLLRDDGAGNMMVECGSCHDPHNGGLVQGAADGEVNFLRVSNASSALCVGCHNK